VTWRGDSAGEDGCLRGRDHGTADSTGQVSSEIHGCDVDQAPPRGTGMDACIQGRPDPLPARQPHNHTEDSREKQEQKTREAKKASPPIHTGALSKKRMQ
jgi:hypothetical protein